MVTVVCRPMGQDYGHLNWDEVRPATHHVKILIISTRLLVQVLGFFPKCRVVE